MSRLNQSIVIAGAAETDIGKLPHLSEMDLRVDAAHRALADAGLTLADVDGITSAVDSPINIAHCLGVTPKWYDGTSVGGCSFLIHVRHAAAAIRAGLCSTVLVLHGESGLSRVGRAPRSVASDSMLGQFEIPFGSGVPPNTFTLPVLRYLRETGTTHEQLAEVVVAQSHWAQGNPRAARNKLLTVQDVMSAPIIAWPFTKLECCVRADGGGALLITSADRARGLRTAAKLIHVLGTGEACDSGMVSMMDDMTRSKAFRLSSAQAFAEAGLAPKDIDHLMIYDAFAHLPLYGLADCGFVERGEAGRFIEEGHTRPGGRLPMNTNGGGILYTHTGMYGMFAILEAVRQLRGEAFRQVESVRTSFVQGVGGMFAAASALVLSNEPQ
ncbi:thiolase C-terminal domain-containing protein [Cupriavidus alkaliphilus]|uniref:thiolase C-terminal domain-containing protein n=1 Tax=Cupriavidus alkaliphilus TaxID=942866 RepID=UPI001618D66B|nr:thiolase [Cupriavidus alkaliphilus]MBB2919336.1 acetyl-CoA acetyltransferase [Cupriavidus alkaliphilus]